MKDGYIRAARFCYRAIAAETRVTAALERFGARIVRWNLDATNPLPRSREPVYWALPEDHPHHPRDRDYSRHPVGCTCHAGSVAGYFENRNASVPQKLRQIMHTVATGDHRKPPE